MTAESTEEGAPKDVREGVRSAILTSIKRDVEHRGGHTVRLLLAAGAAGVAGAIGATLLVWRHPFGHHPPWHGVVFSAFWAGLLIVSFALAFLQVRTPSLPISRAAIVGIIGLGIAGVCGVLCPNPHFLSWWIATGPGESLTRMGGIALAALCLGLVTTLVFGAVSAALVLADRGPTPARPLLPSVVLVALLLPGVALQSVGLSPGVFLGWLAGTAVGAFLGVAAGIHVRQLVGRS